MKKIQPSLTEPRNREVILGSSRQYRCVVEAARQLDEKQSHVQSCSELFHPDLIARRLRLAELCERLALSHPSMFGKKAEEILWRKGYYEVFSIAKNFKKNGSWSATDKSKVERHLLSGVGSYHFWVLHLQAEFHLDLRGIFDMPFCLGDGCLSSSSNTTRNIDQAAKDWARQSVHRCLIALGDLVRYMADISETWNQEQAARFYLQALSLEPMSGMPHNQLGMLAGSQSNHLDAVFHYMRCLASTEKFAGAEGNLKRALQRSAAVQVRQPESGRAADPVSHVERVRQCVSRILSLVEIWFFEHQVDLDHGKDCEKALEELEQCLSLKPLDEAATSSSPGEVILVFDDNKIFKIVAVNLLCVAHLQSKNSNLVSAPFTFALAMLWRLAKHAANIFNQESGEKKSTSNGSESKAQKKKKKKKGRKRHAKMKSRGGDSSEESEEIEDDSDSSTDFDTDSEGLVTSSDEEESRQTPIQQTSKSSKLPVVSQGLLMGAKILFDWLQDNATMLRACAEMMILPQIVQFINLVAKDTASPEVGQDRVWRVANLVPLPEDVTMRGVSIFTQAHADLDWEFPRHNQLHASEEMLLRYLKLVNFGHFLTTANVGVTFDATAGTFSVSEKPVTPKPVITQSKGNGTAKNGKEITKIDTPTNDSNKRQMMRHMGRLWLRAEVRDLERAVRKREGACSFSPYIVVDTDALLNHAPLVKQLVFSRKFVVIIPCVVVGALDELKRESISARDATRWLETQFQRGNRFLRAQRAGERLALPLIKYPKKKEKEAWVFFQILECCAHLARQISSGSSTAALVTLLTGSDPVATREFSPSGLAQSAGIKFESITSFCSKWKGTTNKNHG